MLATNLLIFRITDHVDGKQRLHNGYQILYTGDYRAALQGFLTVTLESPTTVLVTMPAVPSSFLYHNPSVVRQIQDRKYSTRSVQNSYSTAVSKILAEPSLQVVKILINFDHTGEELTNEVFSPSFVPTGAIVPEVTGIKLSQTYNGIAYSTTELYAAFNVARVEEEVRTAEIEKPPVPPSNLVAAAFDGTMP